MPEIPTHGRVMGACGWQVKPHLSYPCSVPAFSGFPVLPLLALLATRLLHRSCWPQRLIPLSCPPDSWPHVDFFLVEQFVFPILMSAVREI